MKSSGIATDILDRANTLLVQKEYSRALEAIGDIDISSISSRELARYDLIYVEANINLGHGDVETELDYALKFYRNSHENSKYALSKLLQGMLLRSQGNFIDAKEALIEAYAGYKRDDDIRGQACALNYLGYIFHSLGDFDSAISNLKTCLGIYTERNDVHCAAAISMNLAQIYRARGEIGKAGELFTELEPTAQQLSDKNVCQFYLMSAIPSLLLLDFVSARKWMEKAVPYLDEFIREKAIYFQYLGWISNLENEFDEAIKALRQGLDIALRIAPESTLVSSIKRRTADAYVGRGEFAAARKFADEALTLAEKLNERVEIAACYRVYAIIEAYAGNSDATRHWFEKALELFSMTGSRYELADTRYLAAMSGYYQNGERHALLYLAREYFKGENVEQYVSRIDRELKETLPMRSRPAHENNVLPTIVCRNPAMVHLVDTARHIAPSNMSVLLTGPTGCGKDLFARFIHHHSGRTGRFVSVNAAAIPDNMVESELFGYTRGAFTGAASTTSGWIEEAHNGTFYLNEIADSSPELQAKLLDVIENRRICRLGERQEREIDCRIIAATNHDLDKLIDTGRFRLDLYHRLNEIPIDLPSLAERSDDIKPLIEYFFKSERVEMAGHGDSVAFDRLAAILADRSWPGNVRELEIEVKRLILLSRKSVTRMLELSTINQRSKKDETLAALERAGWNRREAARALGVSESTVRHRIKTYKLTPEDNS